MTTPMPAPTAIPPRRRRLAPFIGPLVAVLLTAATFWAFHHMSAGLGIGDVTTQLLLIPPPAIALAILCTIAGYIAVGCYDIVATEVVAPGRVNRWRAAWSGMTGFAFANMLGFHIMTGGMVRFRIYQRSGMDAGEIGQVVLLTWTGLWLGLAALCGALLVMDPDGLQALGLFHPAFEQAVGLAILGCLFALFVLVGRDGRAFHLRGWRLPLPGRKHLSLQLGLGIVDVIGAALALYVLLPADALPGPALFLLVFVIAILLGSASHVPGGLGVFEATMILGLGAQGRADVLSALLAFRAIYFVLPFCIAAIGLLIRETRGLQVWVRPRLRTASRFLKVVVPGGSAILVFAAGIVLLVSGVTPVAPERVALLRRILPLPLVETSHFLGSLIGLFLLVIANGLMRRLHRAWVAAMFLLGAGMVLALLRGLDWGPAVLLGGAALLLVLGRDAFYRRTRGRLGRLPWSWLGLVAVSMAITIWLGFFYHARVQYSNELWWDFAWRGDAPRFLRASVGLMVALAAMALHLALTRTGKPAPRGTGIPEEVHDLVAKAANADANVAFLGDKEFLIDPAGRAFLMYARSGRSIVTMGSPVGDRGAAEELAWQFRELADAEGLRAVFYGIYAEALPLYLDMGYSMLKLGEVARIDLQRFTLQGPAAQEFRYVDRRATKEGMAFEVIPKAAIPALIPELRAVSDAWLAGKAGGEKGFSMGRFDPAYLSHFDIGVMRREGEIVAFANLWRGAVEISPDLMRFRPKVSNVLMDALFVRLILHAQESGYRWFNLGAAPLSGLSGHPLASTWNKVGTQIFRRGEEFYHFEGLRSFKQKFNPVWTPRYLACRGGLAVPQVMIDVTRLIARDGTRGSAPKGLFSTASLAPRKAAS